MTLFGQYCEQTTRVGGNDKIVHTYTDLLCYAVVEGDITLLKGVLDELKSRDVVLDHINASSYQWWYCTPLHIASRLWHKPCYCSVSEENKEKCEVKHTPETMIHMQEILLEYGAHRGITDYYGFTPTQLSKASGLAFSDPLKTE